MRKRKLGLLSVVLAAAILLTGCASMIGEMAQKLGYGTAHYSDMEYTRPDVTAMKQIMAETCILASKETDPKNMMEGVYAFYEVYDSFYTNYFLANIRYSADLTDLYWEEEYNFCAENAAEADAALEEIYYALADSPIREDLEQEQYFGPGFFDDYEGESIWDETFMGLLEQEAQLQSQYYTLYNQTMEEEYDAEAFYKGSGAQMAALLVELVALRQQIAAYIGYESYPALAYDMYHSRDYTPEQTERYLESVGEELGQLYRSIKTSRVWDLYEDYCSEEQTFAYVKTAAKAMGGEIREAFDLLERNGLYDITYGENKYNSSFACYLWSYNEPFVFMSPYLDPADKLIFAHEFGHFTNDYLCYGSFAGTDVAEVHSQGMEFLSLCYGDADSVLEEYKLADSLCVMTEQAAYALFEQRLYSLPERALTVEKVQSLYKNVSLAFGLDNGDWDSRDYVLIGHLYTEPMYMASYVVSCDVAFQIYQKEKAEAGAGLEVYRNCLYSTDSYLLNFTKTFHLESPFEQGRLESIRETLETALKDYL